MSHNGTTRSKIGRNKVKCAKYRVRVGKPSATGTKHPKRRK